MALAPKQRRWWDWFFPNLVASVEALGAGEFECELPKPSPAGRRGDAIRGVQLYLLYKFEDGFEVHTDVRLKLKQGAPLLRLDTAAPVNLSHWVYSYYSNYYGKSLGDRVFAVDLQGEQGHHVHMLPHISDHIRLDDIEEDVRNIDPRNFVKMVERYRTQGIYPLNMKKRS